MRVVLLQNVKGVGKMHDIVAVAEGFGRNFLIAKGLARIASAAAEAGLQKQKESAQKRAEILAKRAAALAGKLAGYRISVAAPAASGGTLYAGLKESEILAKIRKSVFHLPEHARLVDYVAIKTSGDHEVKLELAPGVSTKVKLDVKTTPS